MRKAWFILLEPENKIVRWTLASFVFLFVVCLLQVFVAERHYTGELVNWAPQLVFAIPSLILFGVALWKRHWLALGLNMFALIYCTFWHAQPKFGPGKGRPEKPPGVLRVMTYNVLGYTQGAENIATLIDIYRPDVVLMQEAYDMTPSKKFATEFKSKVKGYAVIFHGQMGIATRGKVVGKELIPIVHNFEFRPIQIQKIKFGRKTITFANLHLIPQHYMMQLSNDTLGKELGRLGVRHFDQIEQIMSQLDPNTIFGGDMNHNPRGMGYSLMRQTHVNGFDEAGRGLGYTIPAGTPMQRIDHIWFPKGTRVRNAWTENVPFSDHLPLFVDVEIDSLPE